MRLFLLKILAFLFDWTSSPKTIFGSAINRGLDSIVCSLRPNHYHIWWDEFRKIHRRRLNF